MKSNTHLNIFPLVLIFLLIAALVGGSYWYGKQSAFEKSEEQREELEKLEESSSSKEEKKVEEVKKEDTEEEISLALEEAFAVKYSKEVENVDVKINKREGNYIVGGVMFTGEMSGGYVLGAKVDGEWKIVSDGNGITPCNVLDEVNFPVNLVPGCWNTENNTSVNRVTGQVETY